METKWFTFAYGSITNSSGTLTLPVLDILPISFLSKSTIISSSALSFSLFLSSCWSLKSSSLSFPLGRVPFIGLVSIFLLTHLINLSGEFDNICASSKFKNAPNGAGLNLLKSLYNSKLVSSVSPLNLCVKLAWYISPCLMYSLTLWTAFLNSSFVKLDLSLIDVTSFSS